MAVENLATITIPPDWQNGIIETLEWRTSVTESPHAVEQRMGLRVSPRQRFEISYTLFNSRRSHFDLLTMAAAGSPVYLPLWYDQERLISAALIGATTLNVNTQYTEFQNCRYAVLIRDEFNFEVVEISGFTDSTLTLAAGLTNGWPINTRIHPVKKCKVEQQPSGERHADQAYRARMRFQSLEPNKSNAEAVLGTYLGNFILEMEPNEASGLQHEYQRKMYEIDNGLSIPLLTDVAPFINQSHAWYAKGRLNAWRLRGLLYELQGMRRPIWIPSYFSDFELMEDAAAAATVINVKRNGFSDVAGPFTHRDHIIIHLRNGTRIYRKITDAAVVGAEGLTENILLGSAIGVDISPDSVLRISFITFCRLDQDSIELVHHSDTKGLTTSNLVWRIDPGIGGAYSETTTEIIPPGPGDNPVLIIIDPFKVPTGKIWVYNPSFSTSITNPDWVGIWWGSRRTDEELRTLDNPQLPEGIGDYFPSLSSPPAVPSFITLPDTGSFLVRAGMYWNTSNDPPSSIVWRIRFTNSSLESVEQSVDVSVTNGGPRMQIQSDRVNIYNSKIDKNQPIQVTIEYKVTGTDDPDTPVIGGSVHPVCNPELDCEPYHGKAGAIGGDSYFIIEWWP